MGKFYYAVTCLAQQGNTYGYLVVADRTPTIHQLTDNVAEVALIRSYEVSKIGHELSRFLKDTKQFRWLKLTRK